MIIITAHLLLNNMESVFNKTLDSLIKECLSSEQLKQFNSIYYGRDDHCEIELKVNSLETSERCKFEIAAYTFPAAKEQMRERRIVKLGLIQHSIVSPTNELISVQRKSLFNKVENIINVAASERVRVLCLQETWSMPFFLCTGEKERWSEFAESAEYGPSTIFLSKLARKYSMVIISPILEESDGVWWNTAVIIDADGSYLGKHRKNHLPSVGSFRETGYYGPGGTGHPVFTTRYGTIAVNICYGRHHALNWLMFALNGAEVVFNPAATVAEFGEGFWGIEARAAAVANGFYTCSINRVGTEEFERTKDGKKISRNYYGSSYVTAPNGCRTPSLSRSKDGLLIVEIDLNLCRQVKDHWGFGMTARLDMYSKELSKLK